MTARLADDPFPEDSAAERSDGGGLRTVPQARLAVIDGLDRGVVDSPGLILQDTSRFAPSFSGRAGHAVINDGVWSFLQLVVVASLFVTGTVSVPCCVLAFGGTAGLAAVIGVLQTRVQSDFGGFRRCVPLNSDLGRRYLILNLSTRGVRQLCSVFTLVLFPHRVCEALLRSLWRPAQVVIHIVMVGTCPETLRSCQ